MKILKNKVPRMIVLAVQLSLENRVFTAFQKFLMSKIKLLHFIPLFSTVLQIYGSARFIEFITQF